MRRRAAQRRGSAVVIVLATVLLAAVALAAFIERSSTQMIVLSRIDRHDDLRTRAYSALHATLGVLAEYARIDGGLYDPAQGWGDPLTYTTAFADGPPIMVEFHDESGRIPLQRATDEALRNLFELCGIDDDRTIDRLIRSYRGWVGGEEAARALPSFDRFDFDYEDQPVPYAEPGRPVRTFEEFRSIRGFNTVFFDPAGRPTAAFLRFRDAVSLHDFGEVNVNAAGPEVLAAWFGLSRLQTERLLETRGRPLRAGEKSWFVDAQEAARAAGGDFGQPVTTQIRLLRIRVVLQDGSGLWPLEALVRIGNTGGGDGSGTPSPEAQRGVRIVGTPFTLLEIQEGPTNLDTL